MRAETKKKERKSITTQKFLQQDLDSVWETWPRGGKTESGENERFCAWFWSWLCVNIPGLPALVRGHVVYAYRIGLLTKNGAHTSQINW